ncbi:hypothetical protein GQ44DRAFT_811507 [Phaeosphaeriaceae sp. PMI808]|nr:hypothetical protein GQ44DRAFT_811507 [Phaeosphaeriaceae sp. PMI808]
MPVSTFFLSETETQFSVSISNSSQDVFLYFASPAYSWVGVGFGSKMENSLMFIMYPNSNGDNVTVSPRIGSKNIEPTFEPAINLDILPGTAITNDSMFVLKAVCRNCRSWRGGSIDIQNKAHAMMYAFGPANRLQSSSRSADLRRHVRYGTFTMDMMTATGEAGVPRNSSALNGVKLDGDMVRDRDRATLAHTIIACLALFVIWPLNVIFAAFFKNIRIHVGASILIMAFLVVAYALGISSSSQYNRSKNYQTPHQIVAFIALAPILLISLLPIPNISRLHSIIPRLHTPLVSTSFILLVLTGGLGLHLSSQTRPLILAYTTLSLAVFVFITLLQSCIRRRGSAYARANKRSRLGEENDKTVMLQQMEENRVESQDELVGRGHVGRTEFGAQGQRPVGQGTMPGPQYLLNMHPGVPVNRW